MRNFMKAGKNCKKMHPTGIEVNEIRSHNWRREVPSPSRAYPDIDSFALVPVISLDKMKDNHTVKKNYHLEIPRSLCMKILIKCILSCFEKRTMWTQNLLKTASQQMCTVALRKDCKGHSQLLFLTFCKLDVVNVLAFVYYSIFLQKKYFL